MKRIMYLEVAMTVIFFVGITITAVLATSPPAPDIKQRFANQQKRIDEGIKSGALNRDEAKILLDNLNYIQQEEKRLAADGKLTQAEKDRLNKMLDQNSQMIYDKKHNPVTAVTPRSQETAVTPHIQERITNQQKRIEQGIKSGALTRDEAKVLQDNLNHIQQQDKRLAAEGKLTQAEKDRLNKMLDQNSQMIQDKKNNTVKRLY